MKLSAAGSPIAGEQAPLRGFGGTQDERKAAAESRSIELKAVRPYAEAFCVRETGRWLDKLLGEAGAMLTLSDFHLIRSGLRSTMDMLKNVDSELDMIEVYVKKMEAKDA
jgi:hypothetical protein